jgi:hypothetical protein
MRLMFALATLFAGLALLVLGLGQALHASAVVELSDTTSDHPRAASSYWSGRAQ